LCVEEKGCVLRRTAAVEKAKSAVHNVSCWMCKVSTSDLLGMGQGCMISSFREREWIGRKVRMEEESSGF